MTISFLPIWFVDVAGAVLMIVLSAGALVSAVRLRRNEPGNIVWTYLLWVCYALTVFAVSRSVGHILKQALIIVGRNELWEDIRPYSGAINTFTFMMVGAITLFFERTWAIYQKIVGDRQELSAAHGELLYLNQNLEQLVEARSKALALSEHRYRQIFEASKDMILVTGRDGGMVEINPAGQVLLGLDDPRGAGDAVRFQNYFSDGRQWQRISRQISDQGFVASTELELTTGTGQRKRVLLSGGMVNSGNGREETIHFLVKDIDQQYMMREQMARADKLASIGELSSGIAHEINNPLGIILGYTQLMLRNEAPGSDRQKDLKTIEKQVRSCKSIVEDLLNFARTSSPKKEMCDIHAVINDVLHFIRQHAKLEGIRIDTDFDPDIGKVLIDEKKISQVLINLLMNAIFAVGESGFITVSTQLTANNTKACVRVQDDGSGIADKDLSRIFDPFFTTKPTGQGTGLGLSVSYGIVKNHGGDIWVDSALDKGAAFTVVLPLP